MFLKPLTLQTCFPCPQACIGMLATVGSQNRSDHTALWLVDITGYKTGVVRIGHQCGVWVEEKATGSDSSTSFILHGTLKNWQTCHRVPRCWPHSSICRSPGQGIGRPGLRVTSHTTDRISGQLFWAPIKKQEPIPLRKTDVTSSKMADGSGIGSCSLMGAQKRTLYYSHPHSSTGCPQLNRRYVPLTWCSCWVF